MQRAYKDAIRDAQFALHLNHPIEGAKHAEKFFANPDLYNHFISIAGGEGAMDSGGRVFRVTAKVEKDKLLLRFSWWQFYLEADEDIEIDGAFGDSHKFAYPLSKDKRETLLRALNDLAKKVEECKLL